MDQRNPYNNPHFRRQIQQPDAPEPQNRVQTAVDLLTNPLIQDMQGQRNGIQNFWFSPRGSVMHALERSHMRQLFGPEVLNPPRDWSTSADANKNKKKK